MIRCTYTPSKHAHALVRQLLAKRGHTRAILHGLPSHVHRGLIVRPCGVHVHGRTKAQQKVILARARMGDQIASENLNATQDVMDVVQTHVVQTTKLKDAIVSGSPVQSQSAVSGLPGPYMHPCRCDHKEDTILMCGGCDSEYATCCTGLSEVPLAGERWFCSSICAGRYPSVPGSKCAKEQASPTQKASWSRQNSSSVPVSLEASVAPTKTPQPRTDKGIDATAHPAAFRFMPSSIFCHVDVATRGANTHAPRGYNMDGTVTKKRGPKKGATARQRARRVGNGAQDSSTGTSVVGSDAATTTGTAALSAPNGLEGLSGASSSSSYPPHLQAAYLQPATAVDPNPITSTSTSTSKRKQTGHAAVINTNGDGSINITTLGNGAPGARLTMIGKSPLVIKSPARPHKPLVGWSTPDAFPYEINKDGTVTKKRGRTPGSSVAAAIDSGTPSPKRTRGRTQRHMDRAGKDLEE